MTKVFAGKVSFLAAFAAAFASAASGGAVQEAGGREERFPGHSHSGRAIAIYAEDCYCEIGLAGDRSVFLSGQ